MILDTKESPLPPHEVEVFLFFCSEKEKYEFVDFMDEIRGFTVLDDGTLDEEDKQECSIHGRESKATHFALIKIQKNNFGSHVINKEVE